MSLDSQKPLGRNRLSPKHTEGEMSVDEFDKLNENEKYGRPVRRKKPNCRYTDLMSECETKRTRGGPGSFMEFNLARLQFARKSVLVGAVPQKLKAEQLANVPCTTQAAQEAVPKIGDGASTRDSSTTISTIQNRPQRPVAYKRVISFPNHTYQSPCTSESKPTVVTQTAGSAPTLNDQTSTSVTPQNNTDQESRQTEANLLGGTPTNEMSAEHSYGKVSEKPADEVNFELKYQTASFAETVEGSVPAFSMKSIVAVDFDQPQTVEATPLNTGEDPNLPYGFTYAAISGKREPGEYQMSPLLSNGSMDFSFSCNTLPEQLVESTYAAGKERPSSQ
uniref:Uncharacterized protein n=1 Tax=Trichuris muris TaxID=70415 RepID=A0A5S6QUJ9_TRIMR